MYPGQQGFNQQQQQPGQPQFNEYSSMGLDGKPFVGQPQRQPQQQFQQPMQQQFQQPMQQQFQQPVQQQFQQMPPQAQFQQPGAPFVGQPGYGGQPQQISGYNVQQAAQFAQQQANALAQQQYQAQMQAQQLQQQAQYQQQNQFQQPNQFMQQHMGVQQQKLEQAQQQNAQQQALLDAAKEKERKRHAKEAADRAYQQGMAVGTAHVEQKTAELAHEEAAKRATVHDAPNFDPVADAAALRKAMKGLGCKKGIVAEIIGGRSNRQRQEIIKVYAETIQRDLVKDLKSELGGKLEKLVKALMRTPASYDASELRKAMKGIGCEEEILIEILCTRSSAHLEDVKAEFRREYDRDLVADVKDETKKMVGKSRLQDLLLRLLTDAREPEGPVDFSKAQLDAKLLYDAGENKFGTDQKKFIEIFTSRSYAHLAAVFIEYQKICNYDIRKSIKREMGTSDLAQALQAIVGSVRQLDYFFAKRLQGSMAGLGTKERTLIRVVVSRSEIDLADIRDEFAKREDVGKGQTLAKWIQDDASGVFETLLLQLIDGKAKYFRS